METMMAMRERGDGDVRNGCGVDNGGSVDHGGRVVTSGLVDYGVETVDK